MDKNGWLALVVDNVCYATGIVGGAGLVVCFFAYVLDQSVPPDMITLTAISFAINTVFLGFSRKLIVKKGTKG